MTVVLSLALVATVAYALWRIPRGDDSKVVGEGNNFESYYGKDRIDPNPKKTGPCEKCAWRGCIGAGECRCECHQAAA